MKKFLILTGIAGFFAIGTLCVAQTGPVTATQPASSAVINSGFGSVSTKTATSNAETDRAIREARKIKALKASMADKSYHGRKPVAFTASQFIANDPPPPQPATPAKENTPYLVPETYPRSSVPEFKSVKKNGEAGKNSDDQGKPYSYPGRVSETEKPSSPSEAEVATNRSSDLPKKRPNFFKWMKERKAAKSKTSSQIGNTPAAPRSGYVGPDSPAIAREEVEKIPTETPEPSTVSAAAPAPSVSARPVNSSVSDTPTQTPAVSAQASAVPAAKPSALSKPSTSSPQSGKKNGQGLFSKLFRNQGNRQSSRTISSDPAQPETIELPSN